MKAILEIEAPESCHKCKIKVEFEGMRWCPLINDGINAMYYAEYRHPDCPLKIIAGTSQQ